MKTKKEPYIKLSPPQSFFPRGYPRNSPGFDHAHSSGPLTDRKIKRYINRGFYKMRNEYQKELRRRAAEKNILPKLVYDCEKQDFI